MAISRSLLPILLLGSATLSLAASIPRSGDDASEGASYGGSSTSSGDASAEASAAMTQVAKKISFMEIHGVIGCIAFAFVFPVGGIMIRALPFRFTLWLHAAWQMIGWMLAIVVMGMGLSYENGEYIKAGNFHAVIGLVACLGVIIQPVTGWVHHVMYKKLGGRTGWSYAHIVFGILVVTLGIINGGLGLWMEGKEQKYMIAYGVPAAAIWVVWLGISVLSQLKRSRSPTTRAVADGEAKTETLREKQRAASSRSSN